MWRVILASAGIVVAAGLLAAAGQPGSKQPEGKKPGAVQPAAAQPEAKKPEAGKAKADDSYVMGYTMKLIDGKSQDLSAYKGKVVVLVNVASKCGYTPQYEGLEELYKAKKDQGLVILGFPANNFGGQEPGTNAEVEKFCKDTFGVSFPMFEKISVKGPDQNELYKKLAGQPAPIGGDPKWNFTKFVVDRTGHVVARFDAKKSDPKKPGAVEPDLIKKVDELLAAK